LRNVKFVWSRLLAFDLKNDNYIELLTAAILAYLKEAVTGMEPTKEPRMLVRPRAIISWLESTGFPLAARYRE
jgi:hypothetical protein